MAKFLFTMAPANDLGLPTRLVPIARALADRGHDVGSRVRFDNDIGETTRAGG
jgi:hypothetical protein